MPVNRHFLETQWVQLAPAWIKEMREGRNANRAGMLDQAVLEACGDVRGLRIVDCGCGEGASAGSSSSGERSMCWGWIFVSR